MFVCVYACVCVCMFVFVCECDAHTYTCKYECVSMCGITALHN